MAQIIGFPAHHRSVVRNPKTRGSMRPPRFVMQCENDRKCSAGITPRDFQLETADCPTPARAAAGAAPPTASMTASTVSSMPFDTSQFVKMSSNHDLIVEKSVAVTPNRRMDDPEFIRYRLIALRERVVDSQAKLAEEIGCSASGWSQFESGERVITLNFADKLCDRYGVSLDWIYRGIGVAMPQQYASIVMVAPPLKRKRA